jgi:hypothetical protein
VQNRWVGVSENGPETPKETHPSMIKLLDNEMRPSDDRGNVKESETVERGLKRHIGVAR